MAWEWVAPTATAMVGVAGMWFTYRTGKKAREAQAESEKRTLAEARHRDLTTHMFVAGSEYIESDTVFAVTKSLAIDFTPVSAADAEKWHVPATARHADFTITMQPSS